LSIFFTPPAPFATGLAFFQEAGMTGTVESATNDIAADFSALRHDIAHLTEALRGLLDRQTQMAGARVSDAAEGVTDKIAQAAGDARKGARATNDEFAAFIGRNPLTAILAALGLGLFIGMIGRPRG
jgi:ElaB/YqjD/DUF883 family membrane-anchored ribosome-binding protein